MSGKGEYLREPLHYCYPPVLLRGAIWRCGECGQAWSDSDWTGERVRISERKLRKLLRDPPVPTEEG